MYIDQIPANSKITIAFDYVSKATNLDATVKRGGISSGVNRSVITDVVRIDGKIVNINNFRGKISVRFTKPGAARSELWKNVKVKYDRISKEYVIIAQKESEKHERRSAPRFPLGLGATALIDGDSRRHNCTIHNISKTGMGLRMEALSYKAIGKGLKVTFSDKGEFATFTVNCRCVREVDNDGKIKIYGCTLKKTPELNAYIRRKQIKYFSSHKSKEKT